MRYEDHGAFKVLQGPQRPEAVLRKILLQLFDDADSD